MEWLILESLLALLIAVGIVAWTMAPSRRRRRDASVRKRADAPPDA